MLGINGSGTSADSEVEDFSLQTKKTSFLETSRLPWSLEVLQASMESSYGLRDPLWHQSHFAVTLQVLQSRGTLRTSLLALLFFPLYRNSEWNQRALLKGNSF